MCFISSLNYVGVGIRNFEAAHEIRSFWTIGYVVEWKEVYRKKVHWKKYTRLTVHPRERSRAGQTRLAIDSFVMANNFAKRTSTSKYEGSSHFAEYAVHRIDMCILNHELSNTVHFMYRSAFFLDGFLPNCALKAVTKQLGKAHFD